MLEQEVVQHVPAPRELLCTPASQRESQHGHLSWSVMMGFLKRKRVPGKHPEK